LGSPLARMQLAKASADPPAPGAIEPGPTAPPRAVAVDAEVLALLTVAAVGLGALPPYPVTRIPLATVARASGRARDKRVGRFGLMLAGIVSPCGSSRWAHRFYATGGFRPVSSLMADSGSCMRPGNRRETLARLP
jgi:hypothetical protein